VSSGGGKAIESARRKPSNDTEVKRSLLQATAALIATGRGVEAIEESVYPLQGSTTRRRPTRVVRKKKKKKTEQRSAG